MINLLSILNNPDVISSIPSAMTYFEPPTVVYTLNKSISSKIFNFNKFIASLDVPAFLKDGSILPCSCPSSLRVFLLEVLSKLFCN